MATKALAVAKDPQPTNDSVAGHFVTRAPITLKTSATEASSNQTDTGVWCEALTLSLHLNVTASSSPTTLDCDIQGSADGTHWFKLGSFAQLGAVSTGDSYLECPGARYVRPYSTIVGTSYTYSITGTYRFR
jgi:hypothetical protein